jgi:glycosyltransferase involved in cell wall biosynthesis
MAGAGEETPRPSEGVPARVGLVAPLPPQVGGVASVAEWLLEHGDEIGVRYETFDLWRPAGGEAGGRFTFAAASRQAMLLPRFVGWLRTAPRVVHYCVSCTATGLSRDLVYVGVLRLSGRKTVAHLQVVPERAPLRALLLRILDRMVVEWVGVGPATTRLLGNIGIDARWVSNPVRLDVTGRRGTRSHSVRLLVVGRYGKRKGGPELIAAVAKAQNAGVTATLRFVGSEEHEGEEAELRAEVDRHALDGAVEFVGTARGDELLAHYAAADVFCLPSKREGLPLAILEAMAAGLPVLATPVGAIADVVEDGQHGILVPPGDSDALAEAITRLASDRELRERLGAAARERVVALCAPVQIARQWRAVYAAAGEEA